MVEDGILSKPFGGLRVNLELLTVYMAVRLDTVLLLRCVPGAEPLHPDLQFKLHLLLPASSSPHSSG